MKSYKQSKINKQSGAAMLIAVVFFIFISLAIISGLVTPSVREFKISADSLRSKQSFFLSESAVEDAFYRLKEGLPIDSSETLNINGNTATITISDSGSEKIITAVGDVSSRQRSSEIVLTPGTGVSFSYGVQSGQGGFTMGNGSMIKGSVYSNGPITGSGTITGSATSANSSSLFADQTNDTGIPAYDVTFGNANSTQDFAQSFQVSTTDVVNKVQLYLKKVSVPGNLTVRIVTDNIGSPSTTVLASGSLSASLVSTNYGWVDVPFSSNPQLVAGTTYWIVIDGTTNSGRYYITGANSGVYLSGTGKIGQYAGIWNNTSPAGLDAFFKVYLGGLTGIINGITVGTVGTGNAYAHTINNSTVSGTKYCQTTNNLPFCDTSLADPVQLPMSISDQNILDWKAEASAGGTHVGNFVVSGTSSSVGPQRITGDLTVSNNGYLTVRGTLWVEGNINISNNAYVSLDPSYGSGDGVIVTDGTILVGNNANFTGSGDPNSYLMLLTTSSSASAVSLQNNAGAVILYAANGTINVSNNAGATALTAKTISLSNNAIIDYQTGIMNSNFTNPATGSWSVNSWKEVE